MSRAPERLHVTQPTLSRQISDLERELGCALLVRHSRSVEPTEEGLHLMGRASDIVSLADLTESEYQERKGVVEGDIRIACGESNGMAVIADCVRDFLKAHPQVRFRLHSGNAEYVVERLERGLDDFAVLFDYPQIGRYEHVRLPHAEEWGVYVPSGDPLACGESVSPQSLEGRSLIVSERSLEIDNLSSWFGDSLRRVEITATYTLGYNALVLAREGAGIMLGFRGLTATGPGTRLEFRPLRPRVTAYADFAWRRGQRLSNAASLFREQVIERTA